jgi:hypothetical protein
MYVYMYDIHIVQSYLTDHLPPWRLSQMGLLIEMGKLASPSEFPEGCEADGGSYRPRMALTGHNPTSSVLNSTPQSRHWHPRK